MKRKRYYVREVGADYWIGPYRKLRDARRDMRALNAWWTTRSYQLEIGS